MPLRKNNPNDRMAAQTPPPRTGTADSGYYGNDQDEDAARPQSSGAERTWAFNGAPFRRRSILDVNNRRTAEVTEESRRQLAENVRVQRERQAELQRAMDQRDLAERDAAERWIEDEEERQAIAASARVAQEEADQRQEDLDLAIAMANSAAEAEEAERLGAMEAALEARRARVQNEFEDRQRAANLRATQAAAQLSLQQEAQRKERAARAAQAAQEAERQHLQEEAEHRRVAADVKATQELLQQEAEARRCKERAAQAAEGTRKRQEEAERQSAAEQRAYDEAAAVLKKDQEDLDFALALSLEEVHEEAEVDSRPQHALPTSESGIALQLLQEFKRLHDSVERCEATILASEQQDESPPIARVGDQADISFQKTQSRLCSQDDDDDDDMFFDAPESAALVDQNVVQRHLAQAGEDWSDRAVMNSPLLAPMPRPIPLQTQLEHPVQPSPATVNEEDMRLARPYLPELPLRGVGSPYYEPTRPSRQSNLVSESPAKLKHVQDVSPAPSSPPSTTSGVVTHSSSTNRPITIYGNVNINNEINVVVPAENSRSLLKRALSQSINKARGKTTGIATVTSVARGQTEQVAALIRSGVENAMDNLNIGGSLYVTNADRSLRMIDEAYETSSRPESRSSNSSLVADLEAVQERLRTPCAQSMQQARSEDNGSPVSLPARPLRVVNTSSTPSPLTPVSTATRPAPSVRRSSQSHSLPSPAYRHPSVLESSSEGSEFHDSGVCQSDVQSSPSGAAPSPPRPAVGIPPHSASVTRKPMPDRFNRPSRNQLAPIREPSADSMRAQSDSPSYMQRVLGRKRVHPPVNTEWANVPAATQDLEFTNSHAMMGVNRFDDSRHEMPILPQRTGDAAAPTIDRTITPNTKAKKTEKDAQKRLRGLM
ncbi:hypothetical protein HBH52_108860 [Parastagonospora nodorum]|nr:hypothetical protein HBH52_108860 [Parastagonospora nodorum]